MKLIEISALAIRIIGIFLLFRTLKYFVAWFIALRNVGVSEVVNEQLANVTVYGIPAFISLVLILFPVSLAKILVPKSSEVADENDQATIRFLYALVVAIGVYIIAKALPDIAYNILTLISINSFYPMNGGDALNEYIINTIVSFIELFIGFVMAIKTERVLSAIKKARQ
jgi:hypothetical protein